MPAITIPHDDLITFCQQHPIRKMALFGSALREDYGPESDIDVLVEFDTDARVTLLDMSAMQDELSALLGRAVDLNTPKFLSRYFRQQVLETAFVVYER